MAKKHQLKKKSPVKLNFLDPSTIDGLEEKLVHLNRVTKVVKGGRTFSFAAFVVVGNKKGVVGIGYGKAKEIPEAIRKAAAEAKKRLCKINLHHSSIPFTIQAKFCASKVRLIPASQGSGVIAGKNIHSVLEYAGVANILSKTYGSRNTINSSKAAFKALLQLTSPHEMARNRGLTLKEFYN